MDNVIPLLQVPSASEAEKIIRELVAIGQVAWSNHCKQRMEERNISTLQILRCLEKGRVTEPPIYSHTKGGGYEVVVEKGTAGEWLRVVVCLKLNQKLLVITAIKI